MANEKQKNAEKAKYFISPIGHIRDRIIIHENPDFPKEGLSLGLNGFHFLAKPGVEIDIPRPVRKMLDTRVITTSTQGQDGVVYTRNIPRVSYTLIKENVGKDGKGSPEQDIPGPEVIAAAQDLADKHDFPG
jgi:hypothetical protein